MNNNIRELKKLFLLIKNKSLNKSLRNGPTGLGYTFESLIGKSEDRLSIPDFKGIEIKTKLGYTKTPLTLFCQSPLKDNDNAIKYIYDNFGYPNKHDRLFKSFKADVYYNKNNFVANKYIFKTIIDANSNKLKLIIYDLKFRCICKEIYWDLDELKNRLLTKLSYLAIIKGYPYKQNNIIYYKYTSLTVYKLINFTTFLDLIKKDKIYISFNIDIYLKEERYGNIKDRGTAFKLKLESIEELFSKI